jgi:hypothetical protein
MFARHLAATAAVAMGTAALGLCTAATASAAVSNDEAFLIQIRNVGISFASPQVAVHSGHRVCADMAAGVEAVDIATEIVRETNLTPRLAALFVIDATQAYCPELSR